MKKGFTLIELLVVIAIIGLLASVVSGSLGKARLKAKEASIKESLVNLRTAMEIYRSENGNYGTGYSGQCDTAPGAWADPKIKPILSSIKTNLQDPYFPCSANGDKWGLIVFLPASQTHLCVDYTSRIEENTDQIWNMKFYSDCTSSE